MFDLTDNKVMIDGNTKVCILIGNPVGHTLSPLIHNTLASICGHDLVYAACSVNPGKVKRAVEGAYELGILGLNVTVPHKIEVMDALCGVDDIAGQIGAVNTLVRTDHGFKGYNTDIYGLERALLSEGVSIEGETVVILGAGGAARACAFLCGLRKASKVYILNRSVDKAEELATAVNNYSGYSICTPLPLDKYESINEESFVALQATSIGLYPDVNRAVIEDEAFYKRVRFGFDLIYKPAETAFMKLVRRGGGECACGLKMLMYQGIAAYEMWNDTSVDDKQAGIVYSVLTEAAYR